MLAGRSGVLKLPFLEEGVAVVASLLALLVQSLCSGSAGLMKSLEGLSTEDLEEL